jgi:hypothetical protein
MENKDDDDDELSNFILLKKMKPLRLGSGAEVGRQGVRE